MVVFGRRRCDGWRCDTMRCDARGAFAKQCRSSLPFLGMLAPQRYGTGANCAEMAQRGARNMFVGQFRRSMVLPLCAYECG